MKFTSRFALAAALGFSVAMTGVAAPAYAAKKKDEKPAAPSLKLSEAIRKELLPAQEALSKNDFATAQAKLDAARALATTPDEKYMVATLSLNLGILTKDEAKKCSSIDDMVASGKIEAVDQPKFLGAQGHCAYESKNLPKAEQAYLAAVAAGSTDQDVMARLADTQSRNGKPVEALATLQTAIGQMTKAGAAVPSEWYARGADIASRGKLVPQFVTVTTQWVAAYPTAQNWHDSLFIYRQLANLQSDADLDLMRLGRAAGVLPLAGQATYIDYALAVYLKYPGEAIAVLNEGIKAGKLSKATSKNTSEILALSEPKVGADKASLPASATAASGPKATFKSVESTGDAFYGYADFAKAADIYKIALTKPGADLGLGNVRLGAALAQAGDKEGARAAFNAVTTGPYLVLANYWKALLDHPAVG